MSTPHALHGFVRPDSDRRRILWLCDWCAVVSCVYLIEGRAVARRTDNTLLLWLVGAAAVLIAGVGLAPLLHGERRQGVFVWLCVLAAAAYPFGHPMLS